MTMSAKDTEDMACIARIANKDKSAIDMIFARYQLPLCRFITRMVRNEAIAAELTNEVFLKVWKFAGTFSEKSKVSTWIFRIARNEALSFLRKRADDPMDEEAMFAMVDVSDSPEVSAEKADIATKIRQCLMELSPEHREVIEFVYYQEMSVKEVSEIVGIPTNTVKTRVFNARSKLGAMLYDAGLDRGWP